MSIEHIEGPTPICDIDMGSQRVEPMIFVGGDGVAGTLEPSSAITSAIAIASTFPLACRMLVL